MVNRHRSIPLFIGKYEITLKNCQVASWLQIPLKLSEVQENLQLYES